MAIGLGRREMVSVMKLPATIVLGVFIMGAGPVSGVAAETNNQMSASIVDARMSVSEAHAASKQGDIVLVDIRSRREWLQTGVAETAVPISMHESSFIGKLETAMSENPGKPIALICAAGVRSSYMRKMLMTRGLTNIIDVPEGMMGSKAGPGWINSGLPIVHEKK